MSQPKRPVVRALREAYLEVDEGGATPAAEPVPEDSGALPESGSYLEVDEGGGPAPAYAPSTAADAAPLPMAGPRKSGDAQDLKIVTALAEEELPLFAALWPGVED